MACLLLELRGVPPRRGHRRPAVVLPDGHHPVSLSVGPQPQLLARIAPGIIRGGAAGLLLALERLFSRRLRRTAARAALHAVAGAAAGAGAGEGAGPR